jgi:hypothetical protein
LIVAFAAPLSDAGRAAMGALKTPGLDALLASARELRRDEGDETSPTTPHERALARSLGWPADGVLPWAARAARADGIEVGERAWGLLTPVHWRVGTDAVHLADPQSLALDEAASRALLDAVRPLFESEGFALAWGAPLRWYASHPLFGQFPTASLDRVVGRNVDRWLPAQKEARLIRRLQNEVQMLLHTHEINAQREACGALPVNSFWLSGCGVVQPEAVHDARLDTRLAGPALNEDWAAWSAAWATLDAERAANPPQRLTLCGERSSVTCERAERSLWQRVTATFGPARPARDLLSML